MLLGVVLQIASEIVGESVFVLHFLFLVIEKPAFVPRQFGFAAVGAVQDVLEFVLAFWRQGQRVEIECDGFTRADDENAFAVLRDEVCAVYDTIVNVVAKVFRKGAADDRKGAAFCGLPLRRAQV